jgi:hypothetical protein
MGMGMCMGMGKDIWHGRIWMRYSTLKEELFLSKTRYR